MDAKKKALFRAKLREANQNREKRIDSPLVRYNENDQPVCKVCNVTLKSESQWPAHQVSRKHREAIENMKALAIARADQQKESEKSQSSSKMASDIFEKDEMNKRPDGETESNVDLGLPRSLPEASSSMKSTDQLRKAKSSESKQDKNQLPDGFFDQEISQSQSQPSDLKSHPPKRVKSALPDDFFDSGESTAEKEISGQPNQKSNNGTLPEGFFDNKDADLHARGIQPVKVDIDDVYKEFEKDIQENLLVMDDRLEEEEIDAAEIRQEFELLEQREYRERVEMVKKKLMEAKAVKKARGQKRPVFERRVSSDDSSSEDEETTFAVDWRAKHL